MNGPNDSVNVTFCATLIDQWIREGLGAAFIAPGSRSTPLALALTERDDLRIELFHDERSASFAALGWGLATGRPAMIICTSGTAAAHFYAAVIEADLSAVPLIVCTADRPPELWGRGAPQTIDQTEIYGSSVRQFIEPGPPDDVDRRHWRPIAQQAWAAATGPMPGPVHLNLSFREPLTGTAGTLSTPEDPIPTPRASVPDSEQVRSLVDALQTERGVIIAGRNETPPGLILDLAERLAWPVLTDHRSGCRRASHPAVISRYDSLLRHDPFAASARPDTVLRIGEIVSSKALSQWLSSLGARILSSRPQGRHIDPEDIASESFDEAGMVEALLANLPGTRSDESSWHSSWRRCDDIAETVTSSTLATGDGADEISIARSVVQAVPVGGTLVVASSMPVRDVEWFGPARDDITVISNRGANGIDGTVATAIGAAAAGTPTICQVGDVAFLHDATSLAALAQRSLDLTIVVVNNDGGGIFSFLPQHELLAPERYELLFGTPHGTDLAALVGAHGLSTEPWPADLTPSGIRVVIASTDRHANLRLHDEVHAAVAAALGDTPVITR